MIGEKMVKFWVICFRIIVGITFVFSGFVKAVDPLGFTYKIQDYLVVLNAPDLFPLALPTAVFMVVAEFSLGVLLLLGLYPQWTTRLVALFMIFFTPLSLWIALCNPVEDCGCFGDALVISNWQSFYKNLVLLTGVVVLLLFRKRIIPVYSPKGAPYAAGFTLLFGLLFALYNLYRLPLFDFRPYQIGSHIPDLMRVDPQKADRYENVFIYRKEGVQKEFTQENYPWNDSTWSFVAMETKLVKKGIKPKIEDFEIEQLIHSETEGGWEGGADITELILAHPGYSFLMVAYLLEKMPVRFLDRFIAVNRYAQEKGIPFYLLTSSDIEEIGQWEKIHHTGMQFCHADERMLKTMIRSNPGLILLRGGTVVNKWDDSRVPSVTQLQPDLQGSKAAAVCNPRQTTVWRLLLVVLLFILPLAMIKMLSKRK